MKIARAKNRDTHPEQVFGSANLESYAPMLHAYLLRRLRHPQDAHDFTQEIFTRFIRRYKDDPATVRDPLRFLFGIALNVVRESRYDALHTRVTFDSALADDCGAALDCTFPGMAARECTAERVEMHEDIVSAVSKLPKNYLKAWWYVDVEGMSYEEAAAASGFSRNTISVYVTNARAKLKISLQDYWRTRKDRPE